MILITGSTGHFGQAVIRFLLNKGMNAENITAFARNREKASVFRDTGINVRFGNYDDYESLAHAFTNTDVLLFISGSEVDKRDSQHWNIIRAAAETGIKHIIYTSFERKNDDLNTPSAFITKTHIETEKKILETGILYTLLRNALYAEGIPMLLGEHIPEKGIFFPAGNGKVPFASITDLSESAANILMNPMEHVNRSYRTVNNHNYSFYEIAAIIAELTGRNIRYFCPSHEEFTAAMLKEGLTEVTINGILGWANGIKEGYFESEYSDLEFLLGRKPKDLKEVLGKFYGKKELQSV